MSCGSLGQLLGVVGQLSCCLLRPAWVFLGGQLSLVVVVSFQPGVVGVVVVVVVGVGVVGVCTGVGVCLPKPLSALFGA